MGVIASPVADTYEATVARGSKRAHSRLPFSARRALVGERLFFYRSARSGVNTRANNTRVRLVGKWRSSARSLSIASMHFCVCRATTSPSLCAWHFCLDGGRAGSWSKKLIHDPTDDTSKKDGESGYRSPYLSHAKRALYHVS